MPERSERPGDGDAAERSSGVDAADRSSDVDTERTGRSTDAERTDRSTDAEPTGRSTDTEPTDQSTGTDVADPSGAPSDQSGAPSDRSGVYNLLDALDVAKQARRGFAVGLLVAAATYYLFVVMPGGSPYSTLYLVALGGVLAFTVGLLASFALTLVAAYRLSRRLE